MSTKDRLEHLRVSWAEGCTRCGLHRKRHHVVFGTGNPDAIIAVVGEAPGEEEDQQGEPFVGPSGKLLDGFFRRVGLDRSDLYILNMVKCHPPFNRNPTQEEIQACAPFLHLQLAIVQPRVILAVGGVAGRFLAGVPEDTAVGYLRKRDWLYTNDTTGVVAPLVVTYHPSYVLRNIRENWELAKETSRKIEIDLGKVLRLIDGM